MELADWLVIRGARNLVLTSRKGITTGYQAMRIRIWRSYGANVIISTEDITKEEGVKKLLETANSLGPVSAIFNLAVVSIQSVQYRCKYFHIMCQSTHIRSVFGGWSWLVYSTYCRGRDVNAEIFFFISTVE